MTMLIITMTRRLHKTSIRRGGWGKVGLVGMRIPFLTPVLC